MEDELPSSCSVLLKVFPLSKNDSIHSRLKQVEAIRKQKERSIFTSSNIRSCLKEHAAVPGLRGLGGLEQIDRTDIVGNSNERS